MWDREHTWFVDPDVCRSVNTRGFVDPGEKRISGPGTPSPDTARTNLEIDRVVDRATLDNAVIETPQ